MPSGPTTNQLAHGHFRPIGPLSQPPAPAHLPCVACRSLPSGAALRHADGIVVILPLYRFG
jgi:hypothetical protein